MNKLYKYLPFDIRFQATYFNEYVGSRIETIDTLTSIDYRRNIVNGDASLQDIKPILRPFEDLTKELPLTKAAAEMIGMKEGGIVSIIDSFAKILTIVVSEEDNYTLSSYSNFEADFTIHSIDENSVYVNENWEIDINYILHLDTLEKAFDFLRAMFFAVDFEENEYIKLEE